MKLWLRRSAVVIVGIYATLTLLGMLDGYFAAHRPPATQFTIVPAGYGHD
jgi:hypothetical protein